MWGQPPSAVQSSQRLDNFAVTEPEFGSPRQSMAAVPHTKLAPILSRRFFSSLNRQSSVLPGVESADNGPHPVVSALLKFSRQTGA